MSHTETHLCGIKMKLLISLLCLASASAMKNVRTPTINVDSNASSSSFGEVLLQAKAATFLEMAGSTDDHYALLESLKIDPSMSRVRAPMFFLVCFYSFIIIFFLCAQ